MKLSRTVLAVTLMISGLAAGRGWSDQPVKAVPPAARMALNQGLAAAEAHQYDIALQDFKNAFNADQADPEIWFNLGLASSKLPGRELDAITYFEAYLRKVPDAPNRPAILNTVNQLEAVVQGKLVVIIGEMDKIWPGLIEKQYYGYSCIEQSYVRQIAISYAKVGLWQKAKDLFQSSINYDTQPNVSCNGPIPYGPDQGQFAEALADSGDVEGAARHMRDYVSYLATQNGDQTFWEAEVGFALMRSYGDWGALPEAKTEFAALEKALTLASKTDYPSMSLTGLGHWANAVCLAWHAGDAATARDMLQWEARLNGPDAASGSGVQTMVQIAELQQMIGDHAEALATISMLPLPAQQYTVTYWKQWAAKHDKPLPPATRDISTYLTDRNLDPYPFPGASSVMGDADPRVVYCAPQAFQPPHISEGMDDANISVDVHQDCKFNHLNQCLTLLVPKEAAYRQSLQPGQSGVGLATQFYAYGRIVGDMAARLNALKQIQHAALQP